MKDSFQEFYELLKLDRKNSTYSGECTFQTRHAELLSEVAEIAEALEKNDVENLREELGDAFWDLLFLFVIAEEKGLFTAKEVIQDAIDKLKRRKPWILSGKKLTRDEEVARWKETKRKEKLKSGRK